MQSNSIATGNFSKDLITTYQMSLEIQEKYGYLNNKLPLESFLRTKDYGRPVFGFKDLTKVLIRQTIST